MAPTPEAGAIDTLLIWQTLHTIDLIWAAVLQGGKV
jgi:hypothetical protein